MKRMKEILKENIKKGKINLMKIMGLKKVKVERDEGMYY